MDTIRMDTIRMDTIRMDTIRMDTSDTIRMDTMDPIKIVGSDTMDPIKNTAHENIDAAFLILQKMKDLRVKNIITSDDILFEGDQHENLLHMAVRSAKKTGYNGFVQQLLPLLNECFTKVWRFELILENSKIKI